MIRLETTSRMPSLNPRGRQLSLLSGRRLPLSGGVLGVGPKRGGDIPDTFGAHNADSVGPPLPASGTQTVEPSCDRRWMLVAARSARALAGALLVDREARPGGVGQRGAPRHGGSYRGWYRGWYGGEWAGWAAVQGRCARTRVLAGIVARRAGEGVWFGGLKVVRGHFGARGRWDSSSSSWRIMVPGLNYSVPKVLPLIPHVLVVLLNVAAQVAQHKGVRGPATIRGKLCIWPIRGNAMNADKLGLWTPRGRQVPGAKKPRQRPSLTSFSPKVR